MVLGLDPVLRRGQRRDPATNIEDLKITGVQGLEPHGSFEVTWQNYYSDFKICPVPPTNVSGPWREQPWTCNIIGDPCDSACTQQFSDRSDADAEGDLHDGHPLCQSSVGESFCGPCRCGAGEAQSHVMSTVYSYTPPLPLTTCTPCAAARFKDDNNHRPGRLRGVQATVFVYRGSHSVHGVWRGMVQQRGVS